MVKVKKKLTSIHKEEIKAKKVERREKYMWVLMSGKQVRMERPQFIDGVPVDEFVGCNADDVWLHQNGMHEELHARDSSLPEEADDLFG